MLKSSVALVSSRGNHYILDHHRKQILFAHPLFQYIVGLAERGRSLEACLNAAQKRFGRGKVTRGNVAYYYSKYQWLKQNGYFSPYPQYARGRHLLRKQDVQRILSNPSHLTFELTEKCNLRCRYCGYGELYGNKGRRGGRDLDIRLVRNLLDYLEKQGGHNFADPKGTKFNISFYGGEPLLQIKLIADIMADVRQRGWGRPVKYRMTTNGLLLDRYLDFLVENEVEMNVSLDGDVMHNAYRVQPNGKPTFAQVMRNLKTLRARHPKYFEDRVGIITVLHRLNTMAEVSDFFQKELSKSPTFLDLNPLGVKPKRWQDYLDMGGKPEAAEASLEGEPGGRLPLGDEELNLSYFVNAYTDFCFPTYRHLLFPEQYRQRPPTATCLPFSKKIFLAADGKLLACERIGRKFPLGQVRLGGIELNAGTVAEAYNRFYRKMAATCNACQRSRLCKKCLYYLDIQNQHPVCSDFMGSQAFQKYAEAHLNLFEEHPKLYNSILKEFFLG